MREFGRSELVRMKPDDDALGSSEFEPNAEEIDQNIRNHFDLRLKLAEAISEKLHVDFADALIKYTDAHVRLTGAWESQDPEATETLREDLAGMEELDHEARLARLVQLYKNRPDESQQEKSQFWPLRYDYEPEKQSIYLHFGTVAPERITNGPSFLNETERVTTIEKLTAMFREIKRLYPDARTVGCRTWLFSRPEFTEFFPESFKPDLEHPSVGKFQGGGRWGQFYDRTGRVNLERAREFEQNIERWKQSPERSVERVFPKQTYEVAADIRDFYKKYGIE